VLLPIAMLTLNTNLTFKLHLYFRYVWNDVRDEATSSGYAIQLVYDEQVDVIFGSPMSTCKFVVLCYILVTVVLKYYCA